VFSVEVRTEHLLERLDFRDLEPEVINLSPEGCVVSSLQESQVECLSADKVGRP
jgi:ATP-dependent RNA helicase DDX24/MAK5